MSFHDLYLVQQDESFPSRSVLRHFWQLLIFSHRSFLTGGSFSSPPGLSLLTGVGNNCIQQKYNSNANVSTACAICFRQGINKKNHSYSFYPRCDLFFVQIENVSILLNVIVLLKLDCITVIFITYALTKTDSICFETFTF